MAGVSAQNKGKNSDIEWRDVVSRDGIYVGFYEVSNTGFVRSSLALGGRGRRPGHELTQRTHFRDGKISRYYVELYYDSKGSAITVHRLVAEAFIGLRPEGMTINHKDGDKFNNAKENLEYLSNKDNVDHFVKQKEGTLAFFGEKMGIPEAISRFAPPGLDYMRVYIRITRNKWSPERAVTTPKMPTGRPYV